ncbi:hypothetical protein DH09_15275 [Bacillaceae bacterium JMAK1]|nr:hypothetical protein DH09_15275 [Bacillaceae bacterium JMAK1]
MKMVAIDMDGTLLHSDRHISETTSETIKELQKGHKFVISTGRSLTDAMNIVADAGIAADGFVCGNGAVIADKDGNILERFSMDVPTATKVAHWLNDHKFYFHLGTSEGHYATKDAYQFFLNDLEAYGESHSDATKLKQAIRTQADRQIQMMGLNLLPTPEDIPKHTFIPYKFLVLSLFPEKLEDIKNAWEGHPHIEFTTSGTDNLEIMPPDVDKGRGIRFMADHLNIEHQHTVAIGDNYNDVPMFEAAGLSIAMGNADDYIKSITDETTVHHNEDGVAKAIQRLILS